MYYLINFIDTEILRAETANSNAYINTRITLAPTPAYKVSEVYLNLQGNMGNLIMFPLIVVFLRFTYLLLFEKEHKIAQNLRNMGMSMYQFYFSWWLFYTIVVFCYAVIFTVLAMRAIAPNANVLLFFALYFFTGEFFLCLAIFISSFFSQSKPGVLGAIIAYFILFGVGVARGAITGATLSTNTWFSLSPLAGLSAACNNMLLVQSFYQSFGFSEASQNILAYKYSIWFWFTFVESVIFYFLGIYLDQVWPKDTGVPRHPLFCFMKKNKLPKAFNKVVNC